VTQNFTIGFIGAGTVAQAIAGHAVTAGHRVILSNRHGPASLAELVRDLGGNASAGTVTDAADADIVILAVHWSSVAEVGKSVADWTGRIVIDATNQWESVNPLVAADLGEQTGSERNAELLPGVRLVKAFNTLYGRITAQNPRHAEGRLIAFMAGDDVGAKATVSAFIDSLGFAPVDLGDLPTGRLMQVGSGPLTGLHALKLD
jgi:predicted dinucleotide-binding enzyme